MVKASPRPRAVAVAVLATVVATATMLSATVPAGAAPPPGSLDPTFGGGVVLGPEGFSSDVEEVVTQPDGKVLATGRYSTGPELYVMVLRYGTDGVLDPSFGGGDGMALIDFEPGNTFDHVADLALAPDGKIVVVGGFGAVTVARLLTDGTLDPTFGVDGIMSTHFSPDGGIANSVHDVAVRPDGRIVIGAQARGQLGAFVAIQLTAAGFIDPTYGTGGIAVAFVPGRNLWPRGLVLDQQGRAVLVSHDSGQWRTFLTRFDARGRVDRTFGLGGISGSPMKFPSELALAPDGSLVVSGYGDSGPAPFQVARFRGDGMPDFGFGIFGIGAVAVPAPGLDGGAWGVAVRPDGAIIAAGLNGTGSIVVVRFLTTGVVDPTFGTGGITVTPIGQIYSGARSVALDPDGDIVVGGVQIFWPDGYDRWMVARYTGA